tara:strand:+ start:380 stop:1195 length:816 start_codon:yes stop_codon:yes gene_type:complete
MKHNKKRNTAFLYECLIKELTLAIVRKNETMKQDIINIIREHFNRHTILHEDLQIYNQLLETKLTGDIAGRFMYEIRRDWETLSRKKVFNSQTALIKQINETLGAEFFGSFVDNYKDIATVGSFLQSASLKAKQRIVSEDRMFQMLTSETNETKVFKHIDNLTYNTFVNKFNETYEHTLRDEQRLLLTNFIISFSDNGLGLKCFMNEELGRLKKEMTSLIEANNVSEKYKERGGKVLSKLEEFSKTPINEEMVKDVFYIQDLIAEFSRNED